MARAARCRGGGDKRLLVRQYRVVWWLCKAFQQAFQRFVLIIYCCASMVYGRSPQFVLLSCFLRPVQNLSAFCVLTGLSDRCAGVCDDGLHCRRLSALSTVHLYYSYYIFEEKEIMMSMM